ncbi:hypothetical protein ANN_14028 [Periplaneta americana]|uniref:Uncharacterized protein n=1 Tax=Periplaneta americana TaxID=6978 RepID=A0ABQ8SV57_PERAM|nr:hypothetical protein ANN_14028 [Periplaneta americana]
MATCLGWVIICRIPYNMMFNYQLLDRRRRGGPRPQWKKGVEWVMEERNLSLGDVQDRALWQQRVECRWSSTTPT